MIKPMQWEEFADYLLSMKESDTIEFATDPGYNWPDEVPEVNDCTSWYFAKIVKVQEYDSKFILLDYCGGEEAYAIPINNYCDHFDMEDRMFVPGYVKIFFGQCRGLNGSDDYVFVEIKEEE